MVEPHRPETRMTAEAFMAWYEAQPEGRRYELVDGRVTPTYGPEMQGERVLHAETKARIVELFRAQIRSRKLPCQALGDGMAVRIDDETIFEPDAHVRCGPRLPDDATVVTDMVIVVEVASPSTQSVDAIFKFSRYFRNPRILHYLIVLPARKLVMHHRRHSDGHIESQSYDSGTIALDPPGLTLALTELFETYES
jgi:Uma2 family endonuclease